MTIAKITQAINFVLKNSQMKKKHIVRNLMERLEVSKEHAYALAFTAEKRIASGDIEPKKLGRPPIMKDHKTIAIASNLFDESDNKTQFFPDLADEPICNYPTISEDTEKVSEDIQDNLSNDDSHPEPQKTTTLKEEIAILKEKKANRIRKTRPSRDKSKPIEIKNLKEPDQEKDQIEIAA